MKKGMLTALLVLCAACGECVSEDRAVRTLEAEGWKDVRVKAQHGISPHFIGGCSADDAVAFETEGTNPAGIRSTATVCCGLIVKSCTIRH